MSFKINGSTLQIQIQIDGENVTEETITKSVLSCEQCFKPLFDRYIEHSWPVGTEIIDGTLKVTDVEINPDNKSGVIHIEMFADYYTGCKDMRASDDIEEHVNFEVVNNHLIINEVLLPLKNNYD